MSENLNHPQEEEAEVNQPVENVEEIQPNEMAEDDQPANEEVREPSLKDKLKQTVPPVIGWCIFAGALVLAVGIALLVLL